LTNLNGAKKIRTIEINYQVHVYGIKDEAEVLDLWIPIPKDGEAQEVGELTVISPFPYRITRENMYGNHMLYLHTLDPPSSFNIELIYTVKRWEITSIEDGPPLKLALRGIPLIPVNDSIREMAENIVMGRNSPYEKALALYKHTLNYMDYDKSGKGWGRGDFYYACNKRRGNCTDYHSYFIGLARNIGIPAFFVMGFLVPSDVSKGMVNGYHCWAYFKSNEGWVPVDISEADKNPDREDYYFGHLDENRVALTVGRNIVLNPPQKGEPLNYFFYPYIEVDGKPHDGVNLRIDFEDLDYEKGVLK
jgi:transglutaminase-like putative cysteine protease